MALNLDMASLANGLKLVFTDLLTSLRDDAQTEIAEHAERLSVRAAHYLALAACGDKEAEIELQLLKGIAMSIAAQVAFKQHKQLVDAAMNATGIVMRFLVGAMMAA